MTIGDVRALYLAHRDRCREKAPEHAVFVTELHHLYDLELGRWADDQPVTNPYVGFLLDAMVASTDEDAMMHWLDIVPGRVLEYLSDAA